MNMIWNLFWPLLLYDLITVTCRLLCDRLFYGAGDLAVQAVSAAVSAGMLGILYRKTEFSSLGKPGRRQVDGRVSGFLAAALIFAGAGSCIFLNGLMELTGFIHWFGGYEPVSEVLFAPPVRMQILAMGILIPAAEELVFRGFMFQTLRIRCGFPAAAILSSLIFGLWHGNVVQSVYAFLIAILLAWSYERCGTILAPWLFHSAANMTSIVGESMGEGDVSWRMVFFSGLILGLSVLTVARQTEQRSKITYTRRR